MATITEKISQNNYPHPLDEDLATLEAEMVDVFNNLIWALGQIVWDDPAALTDKNAMGYIFKYLNKKIQNLQEEMLIELSYFVMRESGLDIVKEHTNRGVKIRMLPVEDQL